MSLKNRPCVCYTSWYLTLKMKVKNVQRERERDEIILNLFITEIHEENVPRSGEAFATQNF